MDWIAQHIEAEHRRDEKVGRMADLIKDAREDVWRLLAADLRRGLQQLRDQKPGCVEDGGLSRDQQAWRISRLERPPYEATVQLRERSILIEHDFRVSAIRSHGDIETTVVDIRCDEHEQVYLAIDGQRVDIPRVSRDILKPIVTGQKP